MRVPADDLPHREAGYTTGRPTSCTRPTEENARIRRGRPNTVPKRRPVCSLRVALRPGDERSGRWCSSRSIRSGQIRVWMTLRRCRLSRIRAVVTCDTRRRNGSKTWVALSGMAVSGTAGPLVLNMVAARGLKPRSPMQIPLGATETGISCRRRTGADAFGSRPRTPQSKGCSGQMSRIHGMVRQHYRVVGKGTEHGSSDGLDC